MKKILVAIAVVLLSMNMVSNAQDVTRNGNNFTQTQTVRKATDTQTKYTYTIKDKVYPIYITKNGRTYIVRTSKNGNDYKMYLDESISRQICKELNVEYKESKGNESK